jgi:NADH-quinone oxidoreductase subunit J
VLELPSLLFYLFSGLTLLSGLLVISMRNPVLSVFFLILGFFNAAALLLLLGAEYIAMTLVIVYVGAVAVLFLFVVMMLNINLAELRQGFLRYLPFGALVALVLLAEFVLVFSVSSQLPGYQVVMNAATATPDATVVSNTKAIGMLLYTHYLFPFQMAGLILLVAMIGAIVLTLRHKPGVRRQVIAKQLSRKRSDAIALVNVQSGKGA